MARCEHCKDPIPGTVHCPTCECILTTECLTCHNELEHDIIQQQNINTLGPDKSRLTERQRYGQGKTDG